MAFATHFDGRRSIASGMDASGRGYELEIDHRAGSVRVTYDLDRDGQDDTLEANTQGGLYVRLTTRGDKVVQRIRDPEFASNLAQQGIRLSNTELDEAKSLMIVRQAEQFLERGDKAWVISIKYERNGKVNALSHSQLSEKHADLPQVKRMN